MDGPLIAFPGPARLHLGLPPTCVGGGTTPVPPPTRQPRRGPPEGPGQRRPRRQVAGSCPSLRHAFHRPATCFPAAAAPRGQTAALPACAAGARPLSGESALRVRRAVGLAPPRRAAAQGSLRAPASSLRLAPPGSGFPTPPGPRRCRAIITWPKPDQAWRLQSTVSAGEAAPRTRASHPVPWGRRGVCSVPASRVPSSLPPGPRPPRSRRRGRFSHRAFRLLSASSVRLQSLLPRALSLSR